MKANRIVRTLAFALVLSGIWYLLSGKLDWLHFGTGVVASLVIAANYSPAPDRTRFRLLRFVLYVPWLAWQVLKSNLRVARMVLVPRMPIAPRFISQTPGVVGHRALTLLGCSITLTPGTLTVDVGDGEIFIHSLDHESADDVQEGRMARRVAEVFPERAP
jgi:multicomponent Na+:H+ antiporter subunit E